MLEFEELVKLFKEDQIRFEEYRLSVIENEIQKIRKSGNDNIANNCERLLWRQEQELKKFKDPIARYNAVVSYFYEFLNANYNQESIVQTKNADIVPFKK